MAHKVAHTYILLRIITLEHHFLPKTENLSAVLGISFTNNKIVSREVRLGGELTSSCNTSGIGSLLSEASPGPPPPDPGDLIE